jgi:hypothetical protein
MATFLHGEESSAGEPGVSLDTYGMSLQRAYAKLSSTASLNATVCLGPCIPEPGPLIGHPFWLFHTRRWSHEVACAAPPPRLMLTGELDPLSQPFEEDGARAQHHF